MSTQLDPLSVSADLLYSVKTDRESTSLRSQLAGLDPDRLERSLSTRPRRLAFWLNVFNAFVQLLIEDHGARLSDSRFDRWAFFSRDRFEIAGTSLSLNDVRDGILRHSRARWGWGYVPRLFPSSFERRFRLAACDPRVHFALSGAGEHSPPVTIYSPPDVDDELDVATEWFLAETVTYDRERDLVAIPHLFRRYRGDFGGLDGIRDFLARYDALPNPSTAIEYAQHDWTVDARRC
ncbi:Protein of unknown function, DUF547 [Halovivax ruber XH-70]|uniref:DUF547 domain-containing protein n=1 Tax=Halovivax ruber (strain DSM 18193 / JCM 13892 / XH-70) TaxID=797302 RepID=L0IA15_HALRX|nr:DUF547 domain-containing protein [Halovivax ruber]AGB15569.1 Protein of unknown function, DUF547 [Halovivax ruber XH-70]